MWIDVSVTEFSILQIAGHFEIIATPGDSRLIYLEASNNIS